MNNKYKNILLALDLHPNCDNKTVLTAVNMAKLFEANLTIVHAIEHINAYGVAQAFPTVVDLEAQMVEEAQRELKKLSESLGYPRTSIVVELGPPKIIILDNAKAINADLIVVGSHGRHGINILLGSTANAVLHNASCDVLAVRIK